MSSLEKLQRAASLAEVASLLGYTSKTLSSILYGLPESKKYTCFAIPKRDGGVRNIYAPEPRLKLLQRRLANLLNHCRREISSSVPRKPLSHGFREGLSFVTNAHVHKGRRFIFVTDIEDFFPSINFGRVRGFFLKDKNFFLNEKAATIIAQIACYKNNLPQGSPSSPVISDLIGNILDLRLVFLSKKYGFTYSRYADDIAFSTNKIDLPIEVVRPDPTSSSGWRVGELLERTINDCGFTVNHDKSRLYYRDSRQMVTGLVVNRKPNIPKEYYRNARAMCNSLFMHGSYYIPTSSGSKGTSEVLEYNRLNRLEGILNHIHYVKSRNVNFKDYTVTAPSKLLRRFYLYKCFVALQKPLILCEGKTDSVYLRHAIRSLSSTYPQLIEGALEKKLRVSFLRHGNRVSQILNISGGTSTLVKVLKAYKEDLGYFHHKPMEHPVIILIDNDSGAKGFIQAINNMFDVKVDSTTSDAFFHIKYNLYLILTPRVGKKKDSCIEDFFAPSLLKTKVDGKVFNVNKKHEAAGEYGKAVFAEKVVAKFASDIDFSGFAEVLDRFVLVLNKHYKGL